MSVPSIVPGGGGEVRLGDERIDLAYFTSSALSLIESIKGKRSLTDDELTMLALTAAQAIMARHLDPGGGHADDETINALFAVLDDYRVVEATFAKVRKMVAERKNIPAD